MAAQRWLAEREGVDTEDIVIMGRSIGGGVAVAVAARARRPGTGAGSHVLANDRRGSRAVSLAAGAAGDAKPLQLGPPHQEVQRPDCSNATARDDEVVPIELARKLFESSPSRMKQFYEIHFARHNDTPPPAYYAALSAVPGPGRRAKRRQAAQPAPPSQAAAGFVATVGGHRPPLSRSWFWWAMPTFSYAGIVRGPLSVVRSLLDNATHWLPRTTDHGRCYAPRTDPLCRQPARRRTTIYLSSKVNVRQAPRRRDRPPAAAHERDGRPARRWPSGWRSPSTPPASARSRWATSCSMARPASAKRRSPPASRAIWACRCKSPAARRSPLRRTCCPISPTPRRARSCSSTKSIGCPRRSRSSCTRRWRIFASTSRSAKGPGRER